MSNNAGLNVVPMRDFSRPAPSPQEAQFQRLLKECQALALERLLGSVSAMLDKVEDSLWRLADQTHDREVRDRYIAAKDKALEHRKHIEEQYRANYLTEFDVRARRDRKRDGELSQFALASLELDLVNNEDLDETLKINEMGAKLRRYSEEELNALDQRIGVLIGDANLQAEANPFSPQAICNAYKQTCRQIESNMKVRMIFHKLFDDHVLDDVRSIYKDLNSLLIERSILPKIRYGVRRTAGGVAPRSHIPGADMSNALGLEVAGLLPGTAVPSPGVPGNGMPGIAIPGVGVGMPGVGLPGVGIPAVGMMNAGYGADAAGGGEQDLFATLQGLIAMNMRTAQLGTGIAPGIGAGSAGISRGGGGVAPAGAGGIQVPGFPPIMGMSGGVGGVLGGPGNIAGGAVGGVPGGSVGGVVGGNGAAALAAGGGVVPHRLLQGAELIGSLTRLQHGDIGGIPGAPTTLNAAEFTSGTTNVLRKLKSTAIGDSVDQTDGMTIDIVAMLFDQIFGDNRVPPALKDLIGRLQIPVVKVAVLDKRFFSKKLHPARRMLDTLGEFALGLDEGFDHNSPVYKKLENIIGRLIQDFEDDVEIFATLHEEVLALVREENKRAEDTAKEAARKVAYMERLEVGKAMSQYEIKKRAETTRMPQLVLKLLADEWVKVLLLAHARHGNESNSWKGALETMDLLIWSVNHKPSVEERRKFAAVLPGLLKRLRAGLEAAGTSSEMRDRFFAKLMRMHTKVITGAASGAGTGARANSAPTPIVVPTLTEAVVPVSAAERAATQGVATGAPDTTPRAGPAGLRTQAAPTVDKQESKAGEQRAAETAASGHTDASAQPIAAMPAHPPEVDQDAEPATAAPQFSNVTIKNPFGDGDIEVEEINLSDLPGVPMPSGATDATSFQTKPTDQHGQLVTSLKNGDWLEFRDEDDNSTQAKLSYISPLKGTYLFVNRQGARVGEYSLYQLAREFRTGRAVVLEAVPLFDRAMSSLVGVLKKNTK
jgi:hypothetical protein